MRSQLQKLILPELALALASLIWAGNFVVGRALRDDYQAIALNYFRWSVAICVLLPFTFTIVKQNLPVLLKHWKYMLLMSVTGIVGFHVCVYHGLQSTLAINAMLFQSISPVLIIIGSRLMFHEHIYPKQVFGLVISLVGVVALLTHGDINQLLALQVNRGDLWMLVAVIMWSAYSVILRRKPAEIPANAFMTGIALYAMFLMTPLYLYSKPVGALGITIGPGMIGALLYIGIMASVVAYFCWNFGVSRIGPNRAGMFLHLIPVFGAVLSMLFLGESLQLYHILGIVLIASGIVLSNQHRNI